MGGIYQIRNINSGETKDTSFFCGNESDVESKPYWKKDAIVVF